MDDLKLWLDDVRPAPEGYIWCKSVNEAKNAIIETEEKNKSSYMFNCFFSIELLDLDHDAGDYAKNGGDYIRLLNWLEETSRNYPIHIHSMNPVGVENMRAIIQRNGWKEIKIKTI